MPGGASSVVPPMTSPEPSVPPLLPGVREPAPEPSADLAFGAFSDHGPWVLDPDDLPWQWDIDRIRRGTRREVPRLLAPGRLPPLGRLSRTLVEIGGALAG
jgi:hypothetical protein